MRIPIRIQWSEALAVGIAALDSDHQQLFGHINDLLAAVAEGRGPEAVETIVRALADCARDHFRHEEAVLDAAGYPDLESHRAAHRRLLTELDAIGPLPADTGRIGPFLQSWLLDHILVADMDYAGFLHGQARDRGAVAVPRKVLVVEDSRFFAALITRQIQVHAGLEVDCVGTFAEAQAAIRSKGHDYVAAILDLVLPDATDITLAQLCREAGIASVVFTSRHGDDLRDRLSAAGIVDYVPKDNPSSLAQLTALIKGLVRNRTIKALVVDDSVSSRQYIQNLLEQYNFRVLTAADGAKALAMLAGNPDIRLVITDYHMPVMDGLEMIRRMRTTHSRDRLAIIGLSSGGGTVLSARFIKTGANDFLAKPFLREEFFCRIALNMDLLELIESLKEASSRDYLTGLYNRRHFYDAGNTLFSSMARGTVSLAAALVDIDFFKRVNDTHGHDAGDLVLKAVAERLRATTRGTDLIARLGGEEFAVLAVNTSAEPDEGFFERLRAAVAATPVMVNGTVIPVTVSIGVCYQPLVSLDLMMTQADAMLYRAKHGGRNRVEALGSPGGGPGSRPD